MLSPTLTGSLPVRTLIGAVALAAAGALALAVVPAGAPMPLVGAAAGVAFAIRLLMGPSASPALVLAALLAAAVLPPAWRSPAELAQAMALAGASVAGLMGTAAWLDRHANGAHSFERPADVVRYLVFGLLGLVPMGLVAIAIGVLRGESLPAAELAARAHWLADALGVMLVTPAIVTIRLYGAAALARARRYRLEVAACVALMILVGWLAFVRGVGVQPALVPLVVWITFRTGLAGGSLTILLVAPALIHATAAGIGPFVVGPVAEATVFMQIRILLQVSAYRVIQGLLEANERHLVSLETQNEELRALAAFKEGHAEALAREVEVRTEDAVQARRAAEASSAAKSQFLANMSHEIRTPMAALLGFAELLGDTDLPEAERRHYAAVVRRNGAHLLAVIDDILDLSKFEAGKLTVESLDVALGPLVEDVRALIAAHAHERGLSLEVVSMGPLPPVVRTDPTRLRQVLLNLVGNAVKFTERGGVTVRIGFDPDGEGGILRVAVEDTGIGMAAAHVDRLFQAFEQADASMTRRFGGTGLGLAISQAIVGALGGTLTVESTPGAGSTFILALPVEVPPEEPDAPPAGATGTLAGPARPASRKARVLLAEDGPDNQLLLVALLRRLGIEAEVVENGRLAVDRTLAAEAEGHPYDLLLLDIQMPELDGYGAARELRASGWTGPIVALTANAMAGERERCLAAGCDDYLAKPVDREALAAIIARFLPAEPDEGPLVGTLGGDPELVAFVQTFVDNLPARVAGLRAAAACADVEELKRLAHQLKGAAGGYGFTPITEAAARVEDAAAGDPSEALDALVRLCDRARAPES